MLFSFGGTQTLTRARTHTRRRNSLSAGFQDYDGNCLSSDSLREALRRAVFFTFRLFATRPGDTLDKVCATQPVPNVDSHAIAAIFPPTYTFKTRSPSQPPGRESLWGSTGEMPPGMFGQDWPRRHSHFAARTVNVCAAGAPGPARERLAGRGGVERVEHLLLQPAHDHCRLQATFSGARGTMRGERGPAMSPSSSGQG
jgi:hypothetical protein